MGNFGVKCQYCNRQKEEWLRRKAELQKICPSYHAFWQHDVRRASDVVFWLLTILQESANRMKHNTARCVGIYINITDVILILNNRTNYDNSIILGIFVQYIESIVIKTSHIMSQYQEVISDTMRLVNAIHKLLKLMATLHGTFSEVSEHINLKHKISTLAIVRTEEIVKQMIDCRRKMIYASITVQRLREELQVHGDAVGIGGVFDIALLNNTNIVKWDI